MGALQHARGRGIRRRVPAGVHASSGSKGRMKLRFHAGTLRLRLSQSEVARLAAGDSVEEAVTFAPGHVFSYALDSGPVADITAMLKENRIRVTIPAARAASWAGSDETGIHSAGGSL